MKNIFFLLLIFFLKNGFCESKTVNIYLDPIIDNNEFRQEILAGFNYFKSCHNLNFNFINDSNKKHDYSVVIDERLKIKELGSADYKTDKNNVIFFKIGLNSSILNKKELLSYVVAHEFGHVLGLEHDIDVESVMHYKPLTVIKLNNEKDISLCKRNIINELITN